MQDQKDCARMCRVLAAQLTDAQARFERASGELIGTLDRLETAMAGGQPGETVAVLQGTLDSLLFAQAQEHDLIRQMMAAVAQALSRMPDGIDVEGLSSLYVSDVQRSLHRDVLAAVPAPGEAA
ncbi:hypothetical protein [Azospirillum sp. SYSU D00513]|uniref:hypothetical protein n=1 Tax=Azospirillum sp. SYSU D00513 TaxID=2812561 RepID=UPI001A978A31|nr:hypothetical protein [Azospirillum sp. SYSU D00513]